MVRLLVLKTGNIASSLVLELLLDERADREDIDVEVFSSGAKMTPEVAEKLLSRVEPDSYDLILYTTPNPNMGGPKKVLEALRGKNAIVIGDAPGLKLKEVLEEQKLGYLLVLGDSMIGARREFLDPTEMANFNAEMLKVLAISGALRAIQIEVDKAIDAVKRGESYLPKQVIDTPQAVEKANFSNPYARAKARAAYESAKLVGELNVKGCFAVKEQEKYLQIVASAHELLRMAASYADEAREMEKSQDKVYRNPHGKSGERLEKRSIMEKPRKER